MSQQILPKKFFYDNPLDELSAANIAYFTMTEGFAEKADNFISEQAAQGMPAERFERIKQEKSDILQIDNAEQLIKIMRGGHDLINRTAICEKAFEMQETIMPLILKRFRTSFQPSFVECAVQILAYADAPYAEQLQAMYRDIRNPYAQSMACLVFGMQDFQNALPLLLEEYYRMQNEYPEEDYEQGPLLALYLLSGKA